MVVESLAGLFVNVIQQTGYAGIFVLMTLESMIVPVPSELVMPFAGYVAAQGTLNFLYVNLAALLGSLAGSMISYYAGKTLGRDVVAHHGKWLGLRKSHLRWAEGWFEKRGNITVFLARFVPIVRHVVSIPAGVSRMRRREFLAMTAAGALLWNGFLASIGFVLKEQYAFLSQYSAPLDTLVLVLLVGGLLYWRTRPKKGGWGPYK